MKGHGKGYVRHNNPDAWWMVHTFCECGWQSAEWDCRGERPGECWHAWHVRGIAQEVADRQSQWFAKTGHCGGCGQPGDYCSCTEAEPCACRDLHPMGSALRDGALDVFAHGSCEGQEELSW